jgi:hypothetical protein
MNFKLQGDHLLLSCRRFTPQFRSRFSVVIADVSCHSVCLHSTSFTRFSIEAIIKSSVEATTIVSTTRLSIISSSSSIEGIVEIFRLSSKGLIIFSIEGTLQFFAKLSIELCTELCTELSIEVSNEDFDRLTLKVSSTTFAFHCMAHWEVVKTFHTLSILTQVSTLAAAIIVSRGRSFFPRPPIQRAPSRLGHTMRLKLGSPPFLALLFGTLLKLKEQLSLAFKASGFLLFFSMTEKGPREGVAGPLPSVPCSLDVLHVLG